MVSQVNPLGVQRPYAGIHFKILHIQREPFGSPKESKDTQRTSAATPKGIHSTLNGISLVTEETLESLHEIRELFEQSGERLQETQESSKKSRNPMGGSLRAA